MSDSADDMNGSSHGILKQNCRENWPEWTCVAANVCGLFSTAVWFIVLLPQVWKNFRRKSVRGLSVLWATANFTASLINLFFVFMYASIPLYGQISSVYSPVLEFTLLVQFWIYGHYRLTEKIVYAALCFILWGTVVTVELLLSVEGFVEYAAILLWCVETFPQIILNMKLESTGGQATSSVVIAMMGKTTDFLSNGGLVMPLQYVIMVYFSSSVAYINGLQVAWYYGNDLNQGQGQQNTIQQNETAKTSGKYTRDENEIRTEPQHSSITFYVRWTCISVLCLLLIGCVVGFCLNIGSLFGLFAPVSIALILGLAKLYIVKCRSSSFDLKTLE